MLFVDFDAEAAELDLLVVDFVVVCLDLPFDDLGAAAGDGPALLDARLGGLKGSWRFFCAGGSVIFAVDPLIKSIGCHAVNYRSRVDTVTSWRLSGRFLGS